MTGERDDGAASETTENAARRVSRGIEFTPEHPPDRLAELATLAEEEGFDAAFASSHYFNRDPFVTLSRMAAATDDLLLGPGVVNPYETHPAALAARVATLDEVSDGRTLFGLGAGDRSALANLGVERDRPLRRVLETFRVARRLWAGETVTHDGTFRARDASLNLPSRDVPVYVGAQGPQMLEMSAKHADGVLINASHPADLEWAADRIAAGLEARPDDGDAGDGGGGDSDGDDRAAFEALAFASVSVAADEDAAREAARPPVAFIAGDVAEPVLERHGIDRDAAASVSEALERGDLETAFGAVTPAMIDAFCIAGTEATVAERFAAALEHVDGIVVGSPLGPDLEDAVPRAAAALADAESQLEEG